MHKGNYAAGFTLMELVVVMVLIGILAYTGADLILGPFLGFKESESRVELYEEGKLALEKMAQELRCAIPNAIDNPNTNTIRFGMIDFDTMSAHGVFGMYKLDGDASPVDEYITDVNASAPSGALISIFNRRWQGDFSNGGRIYEVVDEGPPMELNKNVAPGVYLFWTRRFYVIKPKAIEYTLSGNTIYRQTAPVTSNGVGTFGDAHPLVRHVDHFEVRFTPGNIIRNAIVSMALTLTSDEGESVTLHREVHIPNVP